MNLLTIGAIAVAAYFLFVKKPKWLGGQRINSADTTTPAGGGPPVQNPEIEKISEAFAGSGELVTLTTLDSGSGLVTEVQGPGLVQVGQTIIAPNDSGLNQPLVVDSIGTGLRSNMFWYLYQGGFPFGAQICVPVGTVVHTVGSGIIGVTAAILQIDLVGYTSLNSPSALAYAAGEEYQPPGSP